MVGDGQLFSEKMTKKGKKSDFIYLKKKHLFLSNFD